MNATYQTKWTFVAEVSSFPLREGKRVQFQNYDIAIFNLGSSFKAIENKCPHKQGPLSEGIVAGRAVFCPLHNLKIDLETGLGPSESDSCVTTYPVKVQDNKMYIVFEEGRRPCPSKG